MMVKSLWKSYECLGHRVLQTSNIEHMLYLLPSLPRFLKPWKCMSPEGDIFWDEQISPTSGVIIC